MKVKTVCEVVLYEFNGHESSVGSSPLVVESHWNRDEMVILKYDKISLTVLASDLGKAIRNATNV